MQGSWRVGRLRSCHAQCAPMRTLRTCGVMPAEGAVNTRLQRHPARADRDTAAIAARVRPPAGADPTAPAVMLDGVSKSFQDARLGRVEALRQVTLRAEPGAVLAV